MYIFELISKLKKEHDESKNRFLKKENKADLYEEEYVKCEHIFVPIDSTKKVLACSKCGLIIHK